MVPFRGEDDFPFPASVQLLRQSQQIPQGHFCVLLCRDWDVALPGLLQRAQGAASSKAGTVQRAECDRVTASTGCDRVTARVAMAQRAGGSLRSPSVQSFTQRGRMGDVRSGMSIPSLCCILPLPQQDDCLNFLYFCPLSHQAVCLNF